MTKEIVNDMMEIQQTKSVKPHRSNHQSGMTLIEIMIVIVIIGLIGTGVSIAYMKQTEKANIQIVTNESCLIRSAVILFMTQNAGKCPSLENLKSGYLDTGRRTNDPWNNPYVIACDGSEPDVYSTGKDGSDRIGCTKGK
ncbi:MAG: prepilin-type N-terminal cleavage/methylation domain-containing protein [Deltaproteobacteria bacterium]|nr:prepilin-type N-terminal cleavage/methylation domain-containing protein [Deltaproteobacteria bacterium]